MFGQFLNENLVKKIKTNKPSMIIGGSSYIDEEYAKDYELPFKEWFVILMDVLSNRFLNKESIN